MALRLIEMKVSQMRLLPDPPQLAQAASSRSFLLCWFSSILPPIVLALPSNVISALLISTHIVHAGRVGCDPPSQPFPSHYLFFSLDSLIGQHLLSLNGTTQGPKCKVQSARVFALWGSFRWWLISLGYEAENLGFGPYLLEGVHQSNWSFATG